MSSTSIFWVDCNYIRPQLAASYILKNGDYAAIIETGTKNSVADIVKQVQELNIDKENVLYIIPTHVHLDHAAGAGFLAEEFPKAQVLAHPRGKNHLSDPQRLQEGTIAVYGQETFDKLYNEIKPIPEEKLLASSDGMTIQLGEETLLIRHAEGHASHHLVVFAQQKGILFTGDTFGIGYPELQTADSFFVYPTTTPIDFDANKLLSSIDMFLSLEPKAVALTHFGIYSEVQEIAKELKEDVKLMGSWVEEQAESDNEDIEAYMSQKLETYFKEKLAKKNMSEDLYSLLELDIGLNAMGLAVAVQRLRKRRRRTKA